jgi:hypothetical protein
MAATMKRAAWRRRLRCVQPWLLWLVMLWRLVTWILGLTGRVLALILGVVLMVIGVLISLTIVGAILGLPLAILGFLLVLRGLF